MVNRIHHRTNNHGMVLPFVAIVAVAMGLLVLFISRQVKFNSGQMVYFNNMNRAYRLAESGLAIALGQLSVNPSTGPMAGPAMPDPNEKYSNYIERTNFPMFNSFYITTSATVTVSGEEFASELHTYANVANIGAYFAALKNEFVLSPGMDSTGGRIYAPNVVFITSNPTTGPTPVTRAQSAEFVYTAIARVDGTTDNEFPTTWFPPANTIIPNNICIGDNQVTCRDGGGQFVLPTKLDYPMQFPSLADGDFVRYRILAGVHNPGAGNWLDFRNQQYIFPPGYEGPRLGNDPYDTSGNFPPGLPGHNPGPNSNYQHVYYSNTGVRIGRPGLNSGTTIYGQILFVSEGPIEIYGNIYSYGDTTNPAFMPGAGIVSSSTAHQAVFISKTNISIKTSGPSDTSRHIEAFFFCPDGSLSIENTPTATPRSFEFTGSWVLGQTDPQPNNLPSQYEASRKYQYMTSLRDNPPPYLPALSEIYYAFERPTKAPNLYQ